jgi:hypothetical protein
MFRARVAHDRLNDEDETMTQETPEFKRGWENHQLSKSLRKMAEASDPPKELRWIIVPDKQAAKLFARSFGTLEPGVLYSNDGQFIQYGPDGDFLCTVSEREVTSSEVLDMRI